MIARRVVLRVLAALVPAALLSGYGTEAGAQPKVPKASVQYQEEPKGAQQCSKCRFFAPPDACQKVAGRIHPEGWCARYQAKG